MEDKTAVTSITFNETQSGAVGGGYDLNKGAGGDDIYMHCERDKAPCWEIEKSTDGGRCIVKGFTTGVTLPKSEILAFPAIIDGAVVVDIYGVNFSDFGNIETIYFSQGYTYTSMPVAISLKKLKHVHVVDNSGAVVNADALPASITSIPAYGFQNTGIETLTMPSVTSIGESAFLNCFALTSMTMPNVTSIGEMAFRSCTALTSISLPSCVTSIGEWAFSNCTELTSVTLNSNPKIGANAFPSGATVTMNLTANTAEGAKWTTFYNDRYNFQADAATTVYKATVSGSNLALHEVADKIVNSSTAVILKSTANPVMTLTTTASSDTHGNDLQGVMAETAKPANCYTLANGSSGVGFYRYTGANVHLGKAYLVYSDAGARTFLGFGDSMTGIETPPLTPPLEGAGKSGTWHSLDGRRLQGKPAKKGVYVANGRKVVIK